MTNILVYLFSNRYSLGSTNKLTHMKYTNDLTKTLLSCYTDLQMSIPEIAIALGAELRKSDPTAADPTERSIIAKLSTLGVYKKKQYLTKRGEVPVRKSEYIEKIATLLETDVETLESMEKINKNVLIMILKGLAPTSSPEVEKLEELDE